MTPADLYDSEAYGLLDEASQSKVKKLAAAHQFVNGGEIPAEWIPLMGGFSVNVETTTRSGPISENTNVGGMTWGDWKASEDFDILTFTENEAYASGSEADKALFDALIAAQAGNEVLATSESMEITSDMITVEAAA